VRRSACLLLIAVLAVLAAGCGSKQDRLAPASADPVRVMLDYFPNADHVGLYEALESRGFAKAGLGVHVLTPGDPSAPLKLLQAGKVDLAISYEPELLLARDKGAPLVGVGAIVQRPLTSIISVGAGKGAAPVRSPADLRGKTVGTAGIPYQSAYLRTILARAHVPASSVTERNVGFNLVPAMVSKKVDATLGGFWNYEGVQLRQAGRKPSIIRVDQAGVPTYDELVVVARRSYAGRHGELIRRFVQALGRGYAAVKADPAAGVHALIQGVPDLRRSIRLQTASVKATLPAFFPASSSKPFGWQDPAAWERYGRWMFQHHLVNHDPHAANALTNEFLAGQGS
jgi:putative hydroxymethylpyrimidine transport system substrate-binding protein